MLKYRVFAVSFIRKDNGKKNTIYLGNYSREDAVAWLTARTEYCAKVLPPRRRAAALRHPSSAAKNVT